MPEKKTPEAVPYRIDGKKFYWSPLDDDDVRGGALPDVVIPMRIKFKILRSVVGSKDVDAGVAVEFIDAVSPGQAETLDEMDVNDVMACFQAWQSEYNSLNGATPGE